MKTISSSSLFITKRVFPVFFAAIAVIFLFVTAPQVHHQHGDMAFIAIPCIMLVFLVIIMKKLVWDLADEVQDCGDYLHVRKGRVEEDISFANIMNVNAVMYMNPPRITLRLITPGCFGKEVSFSPKRPLTLNPFARNAIADDLIERAHAARARR